MRASSHFRLESQLRQLQAMGQRGLRDIQNKLELDTASAGLDGSYSDEKALQVCFDAD